MKHLAVRLHQPDVKELLLFCFVPISLWANALERGQALVLLGSRERETCCFLKKQRKSPARRMYPINDS